MPSCQPRERRPVAAPATPPLLSALVRAHRTFVERKQAEKRKLEQQRVDWLLTTADEVDRRRARKLRQEEHLAWLLRTAEEVDSPVDLE